MLERFVYLSIIIMTINAGLAVVLVTTGINPSYSASVFGSGGALSWVPSGMQSWTDSNVLDVNETDLTSASQSSETDFITSTAEGLKILPFVGNSLSWMFQQLTWFVAAINFMILVLGGAVIALSVAGVPAPIVFIIALIVAIVEIFGILWLVLQAISAIGGVIR